MYTSLSSSESSEPSGTLSHTDYSQAPVSRCLNNILNRSIELIPPISKTINTKKLNGLVARLQLAKIKIIPAIEQIVKTTSKYSEYEFKQKLRNNEPIFSLQMVQLLRAIEAGRLLYEVKDILRFESLTCENCENSISSDSIKFDRTTAEVDKSIAHSMKEIIVNTVKVYPQNPTKSNKVNLNQDIIKRLMELHENIIGTLDVLQDKNLKKKINPLVTDLGNLKDMSSGEQVNPNKNKKQSKANKKINNKVKRVSVSTRNPKKRNYIIHPSEDNINAYDPFEIDLWKTMDNENVTKERTSQQKGIVTRRSDDLDSPSSYHYGRTINLDIGKIEYSTSTIDTRSNKEDTEFPNKSKLEQETNDSFVRIPSSAIKKTIGTELPQPYPEPFLKKKPYIIQQNEDVNNQNTSLPEAKRILRACLNKLTYIRNHLNEAAEISIQFNNNMKRLVDQDGNGKVNLNSKDAVIDIPRGNNIQTDVSTDTVDLGLNEGEELRPYEFHHLLRKVLDQIDYMQKMVIDKDCFKTKNQNYPIDNSKKRDISIGTNLQSSNKKVCCDVLRKKQQNHNRSGEENLEHMETPNNLGGPSKPKDNNSNSVKMDIRPSRIMHIQSLLQIQCAQELYHPNSLVKSYLNNIGLQKLINLAAPSQCSKLAILNDPRELPEMPLHPSVCSLPLSQSDLLIIQTSIDRMKKM